MNFMILLMVFQCGHAFSEIPIIAVVDGGVIRGLNNVTYNYELMWNFVDNSNNLQYSEHAALCSSIIGVHENEGCTWTPYQVGIIIPVQVLPMDWNSIPSGVFTFQLESVWIYSNSWGPADDGIVHANPTAAQRNALKYGMKYGRNGKGSIYVWASGNGGLDDDCQMDGYASYPGVISVSGIEIGNDGVGKIPGYSELCSATTVAIPHVGQTIPWGNRCKKIKGSSSTSAAIMSSIIAKILFLNSELTARDVEHILIKHARVPKLHFGTTRVNAAGLYYNDRIGFGVLNLNELFSSVTQWVPVQSISYCSISHKDVKQFCDISRIEWVEIFITLIPENIFKNIQINIISPSGTNVTLLHKRPNDFNSEAGDFFMATNKFWDESSEIEGSSRWIIEITAATISKWSLTISGTKTMTRDFGNVFSLYMN